MRATTGSISASASPGGTVIAALGGTGVLPAQLAITPSLHDFGPVTMGGSSSNFVFTVLNTGGVASGTPVVTLAGASPGEFTIVGTDCMGPILAGGSCAVTVAFTPVSSSFGGETASLGVSASPGGAVSAALSGTNNM